MSLHVAVRSPFLSGVAYSECSCLATSHHTLKIYLSLFSFSPHTVNDTMFCCCKKKDEEPDQGVKQTVSVFHEHPATSATHDCNNRVRAECSRNPDFAKVFSARDPDDWTKVIAGLVKVTTVVPEEGSNLVERLQHQRHTHEEKHDLLRVIAHCDKLAAGHTQHTGVDIKACFKTLKAAAAKAFEGMGSIIHNLAVEKGLAHALDVSTPAIPDFDPLTKQKKPRSIPHQANHVPYMLCSNNAEELGTFFHEFFYETHTSTNLLQVLICLFLFHSSFIHVLLQSLVEKETAQAKSNSKRAKASNALKYKPVAPKLIDRAVEKATGQGEYGGANGLLPGTSWDENEDEDGIAPYRWGGEEPEQHKSIKRAFGSIGNMLDTVRFLITTQNNAEQVEFLHHLLQMPHSQFKAVRQKTTLTDPQADVKQCIFNLLYTPVNDDGTTMTFKDMLQHPDFEQAIQSAQQNNNISDEIKDLCINIFNCPHIQDEPVGMIVEVQLYIDVFFDTRTLVHIYYKIIRADTFMSLTMDCQTKAEPQVGNALACNEVSKMDRLFMSLQSQEWFSTHWELTGKSLGDSDCVTMSRILSTVKEMKSLEGLGYVNFPTLYPLLLLCHSSHNRMQAFVNTVFLCSNYLCTVKASHQSNWRRRHQAPRSCCQGAEKSRTALVS